MEDREERPRLLPPLGEDEANAVTDSLIREHVTCAVQLSSIILGCDVSAVPVI